MESMYIWGTLVTSLIVYHTIQRNHALEDEKYPDSFKIIRHVLGTYISSWMLRTLLHPTSQSENLLGQEFCIKFPSKNTKQSLIP